MHIYGKDNDGLMSGKQFVIVADSVPPPPEATYSDGSQKILWSGKDKRDGDLTQYKIVVKKGSAISEGDENNTDYIVSDFKAGKEYESGADYEEHYSFSYTPDQGTGKYYYMVIARDARGSIRQSLNNLYFNN